MSWPLADAKINEQATDLVVRAMIESFARDLPEYVLPAESAKREGLHASDLVFPRKAAWKHHLPMPITEQEMLLFSWGRGWELEFARRLALTHGKSQEIPGLPRTVTYTPDFLTWGPYVDLPAGPIELKARRANLAKQGEEGSTYNSYLKQLTLYMAARSAPVGWLTVMTPRQGASGADFKASTMPKLHVVKCTLDPETATKVLDSAGAEAICLDYARADASKIGLTQPCPTWLCGKKKVKEHWACITCRKFDIKTALGLAKHEGHEIRERTWVWEDGCPYVTVCQPSLEV